MRGIIFTIIVLVASTLANDAAGDTCLEGATQPHPTDCNAFYVCAASEQILSRCSPTLHFNPLLEVCDHPAAAGCAAAAPLNDCPAVGGSVMLPHPDCRLFYQCDNGTPIERLCSGQLHWNAATNYCDWPQDAGCREDAASEQAGAVLLQPPTNSTEAPVTTTTTVLTTVSTPAQPTTTEIPLTPAQPTTTEIPLTPAQPTTTEIPLTPAQPTTTEIPLTPAQPSTTEILLTTVSTSAQPSTTETIRTTERPQSPTLSTAAPVLTGTDCALENDNEYDFLPHPDCQRFYICVVGRAVELMCPYGFHYHVVLQHCVREELANCESGLAPEQE